LELGLPAVETPESNSSQSATLPPWPRRRSDVAALGQLGVSFDHLERRFLAFAPEADVKLVLADVKITHRKVRQPSGKERVNIKLVARRIRKESS